MNREEKTVFWNKWRVFYPLLADLFRSYSGGRSSHRGARLQIVIHHAPA